MVNFLKYLLVDGSSLFSSAILITVRSWTTTAVTITSWRSASTTAWTWSASSRWWVFLFSLALLATRHSAVWFHLFSLFTLLKSYECLLIINLPPLFSFVQPFINFLFLFKLIFHMKLFFILLILVWVFKVVSKLFSNLHHDPFSGVSFNFILSLPFSFASKGVFWIQAGLVPPLAECKCCTRRFIVLFFISFLVIAIWLHFRLPFFWLI